MQEGSQRADNFLLVVVPTVLLVGKHWKSVSVINVQISVIALWQEAKEFCFDTPSRTTA